MNGRFVTNSFVQAQEADRLFRGFSEPPISFLCWVEDIPSPQALRERADRVAHGSDPKGPTVILTPDQYSVEPEPHEISYIVPSEQELAELEERIKL